jgi:predicted patatin/cPLA2 family phospholipase
MRITYLDLRTDPERILRQGVSISPYFTSKEDKIDGEALEPLGVEYMLSQMRPEDKLVGVMNYPPLKGVKHSLKRWLESNVGEEVYPGIGEIISKKDEKFRREVRVIKQLVKEGRALLSHPPKSDPTRSRTTDRRKLEITYATGERNSEEIVEFVRNAEN